MLKVECDKMSLESTIELINKNWNILLTSESKKDKENSILEFKKELRHAIINYDYKPTNEQLSEWQRVIIDNRYWAFIDTLILNKTA